MSTAPHEEVTFEGQPEVVLPPLVLTGYALFFLATCFLTAIGAQVPVLGAVQRTTPLFVPAMLLLGAFEAVRRAWWRSRRYVIAGRPGRAEVHDRPLGILAPRIVEAVPLAEVRLVASPRGPTFRRPLGWLFFEGLDPSTWDALAHAARAAGGSVDETFPPPVASRASTRSRAVAPHVLIALAVGCALVGGYLDWRSRREVAMGQQFATLVGTMQAVMRTVVQVQPAVLRAWTAQVTADPSLTPERKAELLSYPSLVRILHAGGRGGTADWRVELDIAIATPPPPGSIQVEQRWVYAVVLRDPALVIPSAPRVELSADDDPLARIVLAATRAELDRLGVPYAVVERTDEPGGR